jgi:hypothetical protein
MTTATSAPAMDNTDIIDNRDHLNDLRNICAVNEANHLILGVEAKVDAGKLLTATEHDVLWNGVTEEVLDFLRRHRELL